MKKQIGFLLAASLLAVTAVAEEVRCRSGVVTGGSFSTEKPSIQNENPLEYPADYRQKAFAAVEFRLTPGRALSIHDYSLTVDGNKYPAIAIRRGRETFSMTGDKIAPASSGQTVTVLFLLDGNKLGSGYGGLSAELCANFPPEKSSRCRIRLENGSIY
ncbi:MAG: hypothetical protein PHS41_08235 [Victivallaceae bacterium]|nr:hypothetical protein [Victivallaceae bacterium]